MAKRKNIQVILTVILLLAPLMLNAQKKTVCLLPGKNQDLVPGGAYSADPATTNFAFQTDSISSADAEDESASPVNLFRANEEKELKAKKTARRFSTLLFKRVRLSGEEQKAERGFRFSTGTLLYALIQPFLQLRIFK